MQDIYIVEAARSPIGKRGKGLAGLMPADLLGKVQRGALERAGLDPANVGQVIGGCVSQVNQQSFNIARIVGPALGAALVAQVNVSAAWLTAMTMFMVSFWGPSRLTIERDAPVEHSTSFVDQLVAGFCHLLGADPTSDCYLRSRR